MGRVALDQGRNYKERMTKKKKTEKDVCQPRPRLTRKSPYVVKGVGTTDRKIQKRTRETGGGGKIAKKNSRAAVWGGREGA